MHASQQYRNLRMPKRVCYQVTQDLEPYPAPFHSDLLGTHFYTQNYLRKYCTLDSSSSTGNPISTQDHILQHCDPQHSPDDHTRTSSISGSCLTDESDELRHKLRELETEMLGPDDPDVFFGNHNNYGESDLSLSWSILINPMSTSLGDVKQFLVDSARAVAENDYSTAQLLMGKLRGMVSVSGEPIQRLGAYMLEGLVAKLASSGSFIYKAFKLREPESPELLSYMHILYEVCPYFKFGYISANGAIAEAMKDEMRVHIVDFQIGQGSQWITLIQAFAARPGGPPHIRITGLDDSMSAYARGGGLEIIGKRLSSLAESFRVPFEFQAVAAVSGHNVKPGDLGIRPDEALAVNFAFVLHHMPDESVSTQNHRDRLLRMVKGLSPKVVTLVEQESNTNTTPFYPRFLETLDYYAAMFESIDMALPREHKERMNVEQHCLARDVVNIIACEGVERVERHELLGKWRSRLSMAGFSPYPLSSLVNATIKTLLENYSHKYRLEERDGTLYLGWMDRDLVSSSAWK
ncbi:hypothetical protein SAY86_011215 [Trapa natans]|uniref:Scarecrow-like transcription factor PAT1 n=1 Tax=Trapa natans TaxID=22666 RepID=A0AAN7R2K3_TRANT|nr:hypothetical protein SAY86_011215 [Trapa natans]